MSNPIPCKTPKTTRRARLGGRLLRWAPSLSPTQSPLLCFEAAEGEPIQVSPLGIVFPRGNNERSSSAESSSITVFWRTAARAPTKHLLPILIEPVFNHPFSTV